MRIGDVGKDIELLYRSEIDRTCVRSLLIVHLGENEYG